MVAGAYISGERFVCDRPGCPTEACHPAFEDWQTAASRDPARVAAWWARRDHSVLLATGVAFDVIETPALLGAAALEPLGGDAGPCAVTPTGRWMFFVRHGEGLRPELADQLDVLLHAAGSWVPAPPTRFPEGPVRWRVSPASVGWRLPDPYRVQAALVGGAGGVRRAGRPAVLHAPAHVAGYRQ